MSEHDEFLRRATFCVSMAATIEDPGYKAALLEMAQRWRELAVLASHREQEPPQPSPGRAQNPLAVNKEISEVSGYVPVGYPILRPREQHR